LGSTLRATSFSLTCGPRHHGVTFKAYGTVHGLNLQGTFSANGSLGWGPRSWTISETFYIHSSQGASGLGHLGGAGPNSPKNLTCKTGLLHGTFSYVIISGNRGFGGTGSAVISKTKFVEYL
jgi:hypothetical protein